MNLTTEVYLGFADPWQGFPIARMRELFAWHSLMFRTPVVQDDFFLTGDAYRMTSQPGPWNGGADSLLIDLLRNGALFVSLRQDYECLEHLRASQSQKAHSGTFVPFKGDTRGTYQLSGFRRYVTALDKNVEKQTHKVRWVQDEIRVAFTAKMLRSAERGEWGDERLQRKAYLAADKLAGGRPHACSDYFRAADQQFGGQDQDAIKRWARAYYLTNLPHQCDLTSCMPAKLLDRHPLQGDLMEVLRQRDVEMDEDLALGLLNPHLLRNISADGIGELRSSSEFQLMQKAIDERKDIEAAIQFRRYKRYVCQRAPEFLPEGEGAIAFERRRVNVLRAAESSVPIVGAGVSFVVAYLAKDPSALAGAAASVGLAAPLRRAANHAQHRYEAGVAAARERLRIAAEDEGILPLVDLVHCSSSDIRNGPVC